MIPFIRSLSELMAITESRAQPKREPKTDNLYSSTIDSAQRKRYIRSINEKEIKLPEITKKDRHKWIKGKKIVSKFLEELDYNDQILSSYDLTLLARQNKTNQKDVA